MRRALFISLTLLLAACGGAEENKVTETRMDDIDSLQGTISDEMPNADELNEQPLVEATPVAAPKPTAREERPKAAEDKSLPESVPVAPGSE